VQAPGRCDEAVAAVADEAVAAVAGLHLCGNQQQQQERYYYQLCQRLFEVVSIALLCSTTRIQMIHGENTLDRRHLMWIAS
jgi:hypothetical protein